MVPPAPPAKAPRRTPPTGNGSFGLDVRKWCEKAKDRADLVVRKVSIDLLASVVQMSPVGNPDLWQHPPPPGYVGGRFKGNWQVRVNAQPVGETGHIDPGGSDTLAAGSTVGGAAKAGDIIFIVNNVPYAIALEYGWSSQAPAGMVGVTVARFQQIVSQAVGEAKQEI